MYLFVSEKKRGIHLWLHRTKGETANWEKYSSIWVELCDLYFSRVYSFVHPFFGEVRHRKTVLSANCCSFNVSTEFSVQLNTSHDDKFKVLISEDRSALSEPSWELSRPRTEDPSREDYRDPARRLRGCSTSVQKPASRASRSNSVVAFVIRSIDSAGGEATRSRASHRPRRH